MSLANRLRVSLANNHPPTPKLLLKGKKMEKIDVFDFEICIRCGSEADGEYGLCGWCL